MNTLHPDLFPETLLVEVADGHTFTTSLKVAEHFHKRHDNVMRNIEKLIAELAPCSSKLRSMDEFSALNFEVATYLDRRGNTQPMYQLTEEAFALVAMGFTGKEALIWKVDFLTAFRDMERQIAAHREREANALYAIRPRWRAIVDHPELGRTQLIGLTGHKSTGSITACRRRMRQIGLLDSLTDKKEAA